MSERTKNGRMRIYTFLEMKGVEVLPFRRELSKLLKEYARLEALDLMGEIIVLRDRVRRHRAVINSLRNKK